MKKQCSSERWIFRRNERAQRGSAPAPRGRECTVGGFLRREDGGNPPCSPFIAPKLHESPRATNGPSKWRGPRQRRDCETPVLGCRVTPIASPSLRLRRRRPTLRGISEGLAQRCPIWDNSSRGASSRMRRQLCMRERGSRRGRVWREWGATWTRFVAGRFNASRISKRRSPTALMESSPGFNRQRPPYCPGPRPNRGGSKNGGNRFGDEKRKEKGPQRRGRHGERAR